MLKGKDLLSIHDLSTDEVAEIIDFAAELKVWQKTGVEHKLLAGKTLGMIFEKSSTRTRVSFEVGIFQLGGTGLFLSSKDLQLGRGEPIKDTARVLARYLDGIMIRTFEQAKVEELAKYADIPVINGLTDLLHPCQVLTDLLTIREHKGKNFREGYKPNAKVFENALADAEETGAKLSWTQDPAEAVKDADIIATDTWASMGQESEHDARKKIFAPYQVNKNLLRGASKNVIVLHCLPAYRGEEITDDVLEDNAHVIFDEAENRLHTQKAIMALTMRDA